MPLAKIKDKGQVTIPAQLRAQIGARTGDYFDVNIVDGGVFLRLHATPDAAPTPGVDIGPWIGAGRGLFATPQEVDAFLASERERWT